MRHGWKVFLGINDRDPARQDKQMQHWPVPSSIKNLTSFDSDHLGVGLCANSFWLHEILRLVCKTSHEMGVRTTPPVYPLQARADGNKATIATKADEKNMFDFRRIRSAESEK